LEPQLSVEEYLERIKKDFFEPVNSYKIIQDGWTNLVVEINEQWIFRFVRDKNNQQITGEFLTCLHNFKFDHQYLSQTPYGGGDLWLLVKDDLSPQTRYKAEKYFTQAIKQINTVPFEPTLIHADLGTNNVLVNFKQNSLGGVIDFGDLCLGDPAADFAGFDRNFGRQFTQELISYYQRPIEANFWTRIEYESKRKMFFVVYFAMNYGFESHIPNILQSIEKLF
jgi:aminoglycoside 2''-phosphotransferase